ncbi:MAG: TIM44-like domain-containing protein [Pseudomonadota bacterium]
MIHYLYRIRGVLLFAVVAAICSLVWVDYAEARRGGGFGSRGARTFTPPAATRTAPREAQPINRSMTPGQQRSTSPGAQQPGAQAGAAQQAGRGGMLGGMMGGLLGGLMLGGLIGMLLGNGLGGMAGFLGLLLQVGIVVLVVMLVMRFLRSRKQTPAFAGGSVPQSNTHRFDAAPTSGAGAGAAMPPPAPASAEPDSFSGHDEIGITDADLDQFEQLLVEIQAAFTREDYAGLRDRSTPEIVSYLSEELSQNAVNGKRNDVTDVTLLQGDIAEAWREEDKEYATVALRYESVDVMRDRTTGEIVEGAEEPTETTEVWTFVRPVGGAWKLSAIQDA